MLDSPNWSRRPFGTHPVNLVSLMSMYSRFSSFANSGGISPVNPFSWRASCARLARLPISGGISPLIWFGPKDRVVTRPLSSVPTPFYSPIGKSVSHLSLLFQFGPSVALYRAISVSRSVSGEVCASGGLAVALGVGDGSAPSVVGTMVICPEDALLTGSPVGRSEDDLSVGSSEPPQASSSNGRSSARAKIPRKSGESLGVSRAAASLMA